MATNLERVLERARRKPTVSRVTITAHPDQPIRGHGGLVSAEDSWEWGPEWQLGKRGGRWAIVTDKSGHSYAVRVQWDKRVSIVPEWRMAENASAAVFRLPQVEIDDAKNGMIAELAAFDAMCADLWERRDR